MDEKVYVTVDRFEGNLALLEDEEGQIFAVERTLLPADAAESTVLYLTPEGTYAADPEEEERRRQAVLALQKRLKKG